MKRVSIKNSVPDVYVRESRDFQLLCDLFDLVNSGVKFDIDTITSLSDTQTCRDITLRLLQDKLGLHLNRSITDSSLRRILRSFPFIVKHKGTKQGIAEMVQLFLNIMYSEGTYNIEIENANNNSYYVTQNLGDYVIVIITTVDSDKLTELGLLEDLLQHVIPAGYNISYSLNLPSPPAATSTTAANTVYVTVFDEHTENRMRISDEGSYSSRNNLHSMGAIVVSVSNDEKQDKKFKDIFGDITYKEEEISDE